MNDLENIENKIREYMNSKITRPRYKRALVDKTIVESMIRSLNNFLDYKFLNEDQKNDIEFRIDRCNSLLYAVELYIIKFKSHFERE